MTILWLNLFIVFAFGLFARYFASFQVGNGMALAIRPNKGLAGLASLSLILISGLRANIGDTFFYKHIYETNDFSWEYILEEKDIGFGVLQKVLQSFSNDPQIMIFTSALITNALIIFVLYHYSRMIELSLYVYITGGTFLVSMNGIRQMLAAAIAFTAIKYIMNGNWLKYSVIVIIAALFHQSALILLLVYPVVRFKAWSVQTLVMIISSFFIVVGFEQFSSILYTALDDTQYGHYENFTEGGANILRVAVDGVPIFIAYLGRHRLKEIFPESDYIVNMSLIGFIFMIVATQNWIFARFALYFSLYQLILISWLIKVFRKRDQKLVYFCILICYLGYFFYENVISLNLDYRSDFLNW